MEEFEHKSRRRDILIDA
ncbi:hypothetical protein O9929_17985 [Vibrio lentus]|nr:hypothetical protein [Vibrio lentus]